MNRLLTPKFEEAIKDYPLYSQDGKERNAVCVAIFTIGTIRWFVPEGGKERDYKIRYRIVVGLDEDESGYVSLKELADVELDYRKQGFGIIRVIQMPYFTPCPIGQISDERLQDFLNRLYD